MKKLLVLALVCSLAACSGIRQGGKNFTTHAESIRVLGFNIPENDKAAACKLVPEGAKVNTIISNPGDWTSVVGILSNILWVGSTLISGTVEGGSCSHSGSCGCGK